MNLTKQESTLINYVRGLCFEDLLDATAGIHRERENALNKSARLLEKDPTNSINIMGFKERANNLSKLAELLGDANADYRDHINPENDEAGVPSGVIRMIDSSADEVIHLFEIMKKYGVTCSLEFKMHKTADPLIGISGVQIKNVEYFEGGSEGDSVIVDFGVTDFSFDLKNHSFSKHVSECQITVLVLSDNYAAWFNSDILPHDGIEEANKYDTPDEKYYAIDLRGASIADSLETIAAQIRAGWSVAGISDSVEHDGCLYIDLVRSEGEGTK